MHHRERVKGGVKFFLPSSIEHWVVKKQYWHNERRLVRVNIIIYYDDDDIYGWITTNLAGPVRVP